MTRSGQYALVEQIILFGAGVAIAIGFLTAFDSLGTGIQGDTADVQTRLLSKMLAADIVELVESGSEGRFTVSLPGSVASQEYAVLLGPDGARVVTRGVDHTTSLYGLRSRLNAAGVVEGEAGAVTIAFEDKEIRVEKAE